MMYGNLMNTTALGNGIFGAWMGIFFVPLMLWSVAWKGWALWKAAHNESKVWFIILLLVNTIGILDILYIFVLSKGKSSPKKKK